MQLLVQGNNEINRGNPTAALKTFKQALSGFKQINYPVGMGTSLVGMGRAYDALSNYSQALIFYQQGFQIFQDINHQPGIRVSASNFVVKITDCCTEL